MTKTLPHISEDTYREMADALFPGNGHSKLARSAVELLIRESTEEKKPVLDIGTLRSFVEHLIKNKGYN